MLNRFFATIISFAACMAVCAQGTCTINGKIGNCKLENGKTIKKVCLTSTDEYGRCSVLGTAKVKKGAYSFKYTIPQDAPVVQYAITGFGDKCIKFFVEPGEVTINTEDAANPCNSDVTGTPVNDTYAEYKKIIGKYDASIAAEKIKMESERIKFLIDHNSSPIAPLEMEHSVMPYLTEAYAEQTVRSVSATLHDHPYYTSFRNAMLARALKVGNEVPNIAVEMNDGTVKRIEDYRGKYVLIDFWASTCEKSMKEREVLKELYGLIKERLDEFVIISISLDKNEAAWKNAIKENGLEQSGWMHGCDATGKTIGYFGAESTPRLILVAPEGRAISLNMNTDELIERVEQILSGDLYYLDQE